VISCMIRLRYTVWEMFSAIRMGIGNTLQKFFNYGASDVRETCVRQPTAAIACHHGQLTPTWAVWLSTGQCGYAGRRPSVMTGGA
jgi:hypothetical protein